MAIILRVIVISFIFGIILKAQALAILEKAMVLEIKIGLTED